MKKPSIGFEWSYRDLLFTLMTAFMAMSVMALIITTKAQETKSINQGNILIELYWDINVVADVDLWIQAPNETPVGYSRKSGKTFNLLRDDLGKGKDTESRNQEIVVGRGLKEGEYIVNAHQFASIDGLSIECKIIVRLNRDDFSNIIATENVTLTYNGDEKTVLRFSLDENGNVIPDSFNKVYKNLSGIQ